MKTTVDRRLEVYGTPFTLALLQGKLEEHEVEHLVDLRTVSPGEEASTGPFTMRFLRVTHSIPDGMAVVVDTRARLYRSAFGGSWRGASNGSGLPPRSFQRGMGIALAVAAVVMSLSAL